MVILENTNLIGVLRLMYTIMYLKCESIVMKHRPQWERIKMTRVPLDIIFLSLKIYKLTLLLYERRFTVNRGYFGILTTEKYA